MKKTGLFLGAGVIALFIIAAGCSFSTANLSGLTTSTDKEGKTASTSFKTGDTIYGKAPVANNPGKVKVKFTLTAEDVKGMTKGDALKGSDVSVDIDGDGSATYNVNVVPAFPGGTYKLTADMLNDKGEKKDSKSVNITVTQVAPPAEAKPPVDDAEEDK
jgi:hypothetical protein